MTYLKYDLKPDFVADTVGANSVLLEALGRDQEVGSYDADLDPDPTWQACRIRRR
jgi:hypothetical protein